MEDNKIKTYPCAECNKVYESYMGLWKHKNNKHVTTNIVPINNSNEYTKTDITICIYCNKKLADRHYRWRHEKICKNKFLEKNIVKHNIIKQNDSIKQTEHNYIYLIKKYDLNNSEHIYKFGKSTRPIMERLIEHGKEAVVILTLKVNNCHIAEEQILNLLRNDNKIKHRKNIGNEYFYCNDEDYITDLIIDNYKKYRVDKLETTENNNKSDNDDNQISFNILSFSNNIITD
jgi:hypothetical protein